jgi:ubiquinone/menaquinone biosynthesis C-methylase UbiE
MRDGARSSVHVMTTATAALYDPFFWLAERAGLAERRRDLVRQASGRVLEIGAGTGLNVRHYVDDIELVLSEPDEAMADRLRARLARLGRPVTVVQAGAEALPFAAGDFDAVVSTLVLCTVPDLAAALREIQRVLKPGGRLLFIEHVRSDSPRWARWQDRLNRPWRAFADGCNCNRTTLDMLAASPLGLEAVERTAMRGMVPLIRPLAVGSATA